MTCFSVENPTKSQGSVEKGPIGQSRRRCSRTRTCSGFGGAGGAKSGSRLRATIRSLPPRSVWAYEIGQADPRLVRWPMRSNSPLDLAVARGHCCPNQCLWFRIPRSRCSGRRADRSAVQSVSIHAPHAGRHQVGQTVTLTQSKSRPPISHTPTAHRCGQPQNSTPRLARFPIGTRSHSALPFPIATRATPAGQPHPQSAKKPDLPLRCDAVAMVLATPPPDA